MFEIGQKYTYTFIDRNGSECCNPIKLLVTTFDNSNTYWNCHLMHIYKMNPDPNPSPNPNNLLDTINFADNNLTRLQQVSIDKWFSGRKTCLNIFKFRRFFYSNAWLGKTSKFWVMHYNFSQNPFNMSEIVSVCIWMLNFVSFQDVPEEFQKRKRAQEMEAPVPCKKIRTDTR